LAEITLRYMQLMPDDVTRFVTYLPTLLSHIYEWSVYDLFRSICEIDAKHYNITRFVLAQGIPSLLLKCLENNISNLNDEMSYWIVYNSYKLVHSFCVNSRLKPYFLYEESLKLLSQNIDPCHFRLLNVQWEVLCDLISPETIYFFGRFHEYCFTQLKNDHQGYLHPYQVYYAYFIIRCIIFDKALLNITPFGEILSLLFNLVNDFPSHSIFINVVTDGLILFKDHFPDSIPKIVQLGSEIYNQNHSPIVFAFLWKYFKLLSCLDGISQEARDQYDYMNCVFLNEYGGQAPIVEDVKESDSTVIIDAILSLGLKHGI